MRGANGHALPHAPSATSARRFAPACGPPRWARTSAADVWWAGRDAGGCARNAAPVPAHDLRPVWNNTYPVKPHRPPSGTACRCVNAASRRSGRHGHPPRQSRLVARTGRRTLRRRSDHCPAPALETSRPDPRHSRPTSVLTRWRSASAPSNDGASTDPPRDGYADVSWQGAFRSPWCG